MGASKHAAERPNRRAYTVRETQEILNVSYASIYRMLKDGRLKSINIGRSRRIPDHAIEAILGEDSQ